MHKIIRNQNIYPQKIKSTLLSKKLNQNYFLFVQPLLLIFLFLNCFENAYKVYVTSAKIIEKLNQRYGRYCVFKTVGPQNLIFCKTLNFQNFGKPF